jgi:hypothetical protein
MVKYHLHTLNFIFLVVFCEGLRYNVVIKIIGDSNIYQKKNTNSKTDKI